MFSPFILRHSECQSVETGSFLIMEMLSLKVIRIVICERLVKGFSRVAESLTLIRYLECRYAGCLLSDRLTKERFFFSYTSIALRQKYPADCL